jgi:hypothetical protein
MGGGDVVTALTLQQRRRHARRRRSNSGPEDERSLGSYLQSAAGNQAVASLVGRPHTSVQRCAPERPDCDCPGRAPLEAVLRGPASASAAGRLLGPARAMPGGKSCALEEEALPERTAATSAGAAGAAGAAGERLLRPHQNDATIVCDGSGGYRADLRGWAGAPCGIEDCVRQHEESHARDWAARFPDGCVGKPDGGDIPLGGPGYAAFLRQSECTAYGVEVGCLRPKLQAITGSPSLLRSPRFHGNGRLENAAINNPAMRWGERNDGVAALQQALIDLGFPMPGSTQNGTAPPDGAWGPETQRTVVAFQRRNGLGADGVVGRLTMRKLDEAFSGAAGAPQPCQTDLESHLEDTLRQQRRFC